MDSLDWHAGQIKGAIQAALDDGLKIEFDVYREMDGDISKVEIDLWGSGEYVNLASEDWI
jgi:hypothetical protein